MWRVPIDGSTIPYYNVSAAKLAAVNNVDSNDPNLTRSYNGIEINATTRLAHGVRVFGGMSTEKTVSNSCSAATTDPNLLLFCDGSKNNIPWITSGKVAGTVPLPWYGITFSIAMQLLAGSPVGTLPVQYRRLHRRTGFTQPNGLGSYELITRTTTYPANCKGACTPGAPMLPGLTAGVASVSLGLVAPGTEFTPRVNELDFGVSKTFKVDFFVHPEARCLQRAELRRLHRGLDYAVQREHLWAAVGHPAGSHHSPWHRREVVVRSGRSSGRPLFFKIEQP